MNTEASTAVKEEEDYGKSQAAAQYESIVEMLAALNCDYDRLDELRMERDQLDEEELRNWPQSGELAELEAAAGDCEDREDAEQCIQEDPLSVQLRSGWYSPGETPEPYEFEILLCTGGPAVRILGELGEHNKPDRAWLEYQDWGTPWTRFFPASQDTLLEYARQFYFGD